MAAVAAVIIGIILGVVSVIPFNVATNRIRKVNPTQTLNMLGPFLLTILISFVILIAGMIVCRLVAEEVIWPFVIAELLAFAVSVIIFGLVVARRRSHSGETDIKKD